MGLLHRPSLCLLLRQILHRIPGPDLNFNCTSKVSLLSSKVPAPIRVVDPGVLPIFRLVRTDHETGVGRTVDEVRGPQDPSLLSVRKSNTEEDGSLRPKTRGYILFLFPSTHTLSRPFIQIRLPRLQTEGGGQQRTEGVWLQEEWTRRMNRDKIKERKPRTDSIYVRVSVP